MIFLAGIHVSFMSIRLIISANMLYFKITGSQSPISTCNRTRAFSKTLRPIHRLKTVSLASSSPRRFFHFSKSTLRRIERRVTCSSIQQQNEQTMHRFAIDQLDRRRRCARSSGAISCRGCNQDTHYLRELRVYTHIHEYQYVHTCACAREKIKNNSVPTRSYYSQPPKTTSR